MEDLQIQILDLENGVIIHATNSSVLFSGTGPTQEKALRALEKSLNEYLGSLYEYTTDLHKNLIRLKQKV